MAAAEPLGSELLPVQRRDVFKELGVCIISDVYFSMKDAYFSPLTLPGFPIFFTVSEKEHRVTAVTIDVSV